MFQGLHCLIFPLYLSPDTEQGFANTLVSLAQLLQNHAAVNALKELALVITVSSFQWVQFSFLLGKYFGQAGMDSALLVCGSTLQRVSICIESGVYISDEELQTLSRHCLPRLRSQGILSVQCLSKNAG